MSNNLDRILEKIEQCSNTITSLVGKTDYLSEKITSLDDRIIEREKLNNKNIDLRINMLWTVIVGLFSTIMAFALKVL